MSASPSPGPAGVPDEVRGSKPQLHPRDDPQYPLMGHTNNPQGPPFGDRRVTRGGSGGR